MKITEIKLSIHYEDGTTEEKNYDNITRSYMHGIAPKEGCPCREHIEFDANRTDKKIKVKGIQW